MPRAKTADMRRREPYRRCPRCRGSMVAAILVSVVLGGCGGDADRVVRGALPESAAGLPPGGAIAEFSVLDGAVPGSIVSGPDGNLWIGILNQKYCTADNPGGGHHLPGWRFERN